jgi:hypothetical protein
MVAALLLLLLLLRVLVLQLLLIFTLLCCLKLKAGQSRDEWLQNAGASHALHCSNLPV